ncbi:hypothetical protein [Bradyrhizobium sp. SRL28]|uniref:hypothetical protein n=1 Tax=Bradyrhizobium sp. SRL28 TaxID=2836178 RepID=UPI00201C9DD8|nr:hypothetical protein [Bradyrhizobium sp. SRL28]
MRGLIRLIFGVAAAVGLCLLSADAGEPERAKLKIVVGSHILNYMPAELGVKLGTFKEEGLDVTVREFPGRRLQGAASADWWLGGRRRAVL